MRNLYITACSLLLAVALSGCAMWRDVVDGPTARLYNATSVYHSALTLSLAYESLPRCATVVAAVQAQSSGICSSYDAVASIREADIAAKISLDIFAEGTPSDAGLDALRVQIDLKRARLHSDVT